MAELKFTDENFQEEVMKSELPVLVDFYAEWCGPCKMMSPAIEKLAAEYDGKFKIGKCDVDSSPKVSGEYGIQSIPSVFFFKGGQVVDRMIGFQSEEKLRAKLDSLV